MDPQSNERHVINVVGTLLANVELQPAGDAKTPSQHPNESLIKQYNDDAGTPVNSFDRSVEELSARTWPGYDVEVRDQLTGT